MRKWLQCCRVARERFGYQGWRWLCPFLSAKSAGQGLQELRQAGLVVGSQVRTGLCENADHFAGLGPNSLCAVVGGECGFLVCSGCHSAA